METKVLDAPNTSAGSFAHWRLAGTVIWGVVLGFIFIVVQTIAALSVALRDEPALSADQGEALLQSAQVNGTVIAASTLVTALLCVPLIAAVVKLKKHSNVRDYLALKPIELKSLIRWLVMLFAFIAASDALTVTIGKPLVPEFMVSAYSSAQPVWLLWLALLLAAPLMEETFFRGFLFKGFAASFMGPYGAIGLTALLWAGIHLQYDFYGMATVLLLGLLLGAARVVTGSLFAPLAMHSAANLVAMTEASLLG